MKKLDTPSGKVSVTVATGPVAKTASPTRKTVDAVMPLSGTPKRCASAIRPPRYVPVSAPTPKRARTPETQPASRPETSVRSGAR